MDPDAFSWLDLDDIAIGLVDAHPDTDPLTIDFVTMLDWVLALENFTGKREESNENKLEAIQMAWLEEWKDR